MTDHVGDQLRLFVENVQRLVSRRAFTGQTLKSDFTLQLDNTLCLTTADSDEDDRLAAFAVFRKFLMDKEPVHFYRVASLVELHVSDADLRAASRRNRSVWKRQLGMCMLVQGGKALSNEHLFSLIVNGSMLHDDRDKAAEWESLDPLLRGMAEQLVHGMVMHCTEVLVAQRNVVTRALRDGCLAA